MQKDKQQSRPIDEKKLKMILKNGKKNEVYKQQIK